MWRRWWRFNPRTHTECDNPANGAGGVPMGFNPRTHTECDSVLESADLDNKVSIHAPTRSATRRRQNPVPWNPVSIHAPTRSATRRGNITRPAVLGFNPRTPTECDTYGLTKLSDALTFQSTHPHGVRLHPPSTQVQQGFPSQKVRTSNSAYRKSDKNTTEITQSLTQLGVRTSRGFYGSFRFALSP